jgi:hypothetical protein
MLRVVNLEKKGMCCGPDCWPQNKICGNRERGQVWKTKRAVAVFVQENVAAITSQLFALSAYLPNSTCSRNKDLRDGIIERFIHCGSSHFGMV